MQHQQHLSVRNSTRAAAGWAASPVGRLVRVEVLVTLSCAVLTMLVFLGSGRRYSRSAAFRTAVWSALMLSYPAVSYTIGLMQSASFRNELMVVWACFLLGCADGITACSVDGSDQQARLLLNQAAQTVYVLLLLLSYVAAGGSSMRLELRLLVFLLWVLTVAKLALRLHRLLSVGRDRVLTVENGLITRYMADVYRNSGLICYKYVVTGEENLQDELGEYKLQVAGGNGNDIVTLDMVLDMRWSLDVDAVEWSSPGGDLGSRQDPTMLCISFALFKLLRRRLTGSPQYELHESVVHKVRIFFYQLLIKERAPRGGDLLQQLFRLAAGTGGEVMYRVVEIELGFLFDFFYARYPSHKQSLVPETLVFAAAVALSVSFLFSPTLMRYDAGGGGGATAAAVATRFDIWLTRLVILLFLILEAFQYLSLVLSDWHMVRLYCRIVAGGGGAWRKMLALVMFRLTSTRRYWSNTVGQYSLLHACIQHQSGGSCRWLPAARWLRRPSSRVTTHRRLVEVVKDAIATELKVSLAHLISHRNRTIYYRTDLVPLEWPSSYSDTPYTMTLPKGASGVRGILVWHIATTICDMDAASAAAAASLSYEVKEQSRRPRLVATTLSAYCAYLVRHAPELVTDSVYETRLLLDGVLRRARQCLSECRSDEDMHAKLLASFVEREKTTTAAQDEYELVVAQGVRLSQALARKFGRHPDIWEVLVQVWVKLLVSSAAPADNVAAHVKRLASGGEFISHLWAFMTQGGFVEQPWISRGGDGDHPAAGPGGGLAVPDRRYGDDDMDAWMQRLQDVGRRYC